MHKSEVTRLLNNWTQGDRDAFDEIIPLVYNDLRVMAEQRFNGERFGHTLQPTALVNEVYLKLTQQDLSKQEWENRDHFLRMVSITMRRILIDSARRHQAQKKGNAYRIPLSSNGFENHSAPTEIDAETMIALDLALEKLDKMDPRQSQIVHFHFFIGLNHKDIAEILKIGERTVRREWSLAKAWLSRELGLRSFL